VEEIRKEMLQLRIRVFDFLAFGYDQGSVTPHGGDTPYHSTIRHDAVRAAKRAPASILIDK